MDLNDYKKHARLNRIGKLSPAASLLPAPQQPSTKNAQTAPTAGNAWGNYSMDWEGLQSFINDNNLMGQYSQQDLYYSSKDPLRGFMLAQAKLDKNADAGKQIRSMWGYSADASGLNPSAPAMSPQDFQAGTAPTYESKYGDQTEALLQAILNRDTQPKEFSYDAAGDPVFAQYRKEYLREGDRARDDTLGKAASMTGGRPNAYAVGAADQAANYYNAQLADKIPQLYEQAYNRYLQEFQMQQAQQQMEMQKLNLLQDQEAIDYGRFQDERQQFNQDRNFDYGRFMDQISFEGQQRSEARAQQSAELDKAQLAYQLGDSSLLNKLGIDTSKDPATQQREVASRMEQAQFLYSIGDYDGLRAMGFDPSGAEFEKNLGIAQILYQYTGDASKLRELLNFSGPVVTGKSGGSTGSGGSNGRSTGKTGSPAAALPAPQDEPTEAQGNLTDRGYPSSTEGAPLPAPKTETAQTGGAPTAAERDGIANRTTEGYIWIDRLGLLPWKTFRKYLEEGRLRETANGGKTLYVLA